MAAAKSPEQLTPFGHALAGALGAVFSNACVSIPIACLLMELVDAGFYLQSGLSVRHVRSTVQGLEMISE